MRKFNELNYCTIDDARNDLSAKGKEMEIETKEALGRHTDQLRVDLAIHAG